MGTGGVSENNLLFWLWSFLATVGGAVSSFALRPYKEMTKLEVSLAFVMSLTFGMFVGSFLAEIAVRKLSGDGPFNLRAYGAILWFMATSAHFLIPVAITKAKGVIRSLGSTSAEIE